MSKWRPAFPAAVAVLGFLVPIEMRETYVRYGERISGHAQYVKFRSIK